MAEEIDVAEDQVRAKAKKMPGPDGILNSEWIVVHRANPGILDTVFNIALKSEVFPTHWKVARLVLLQKPGKPVWKPITFWPLDMLDTIEKILEQIFTERLRKHFQGECTLRADQYGF